MSVYPNMVKNKFGQILFCLPYLQFGHMSKILYYLYSKGGEGVPPLWQKTKLFPFFSFEGFPQLGWYVGAKLPESLFRGKLFSMSDFMFPFDVFDTFPIVIIICKVNQDIWIYLPGKNNY